MDADQSYLVANGIVLTISAAGSGDLLGPQTLLS